MDYDEIYESQMIEILEDYKTENPDFKGDIDDVPTDYIDNWIQSYISCKTDYDYEMVKDRQLEEQWEKQ